MAASAAGKVPQPPPLLDLEKKADPAAVTDPSPVILCHSADSRVGRAHVRGSPNARPVCPPASNAVQAPEKSKSYTVTGTAVVDDNFFKSAQTICAAGKGAITFAVGSKLTTGQIVAGIGIKHYDQKHGRRYVLLLYDPHNSTKGIEEIKFAPATLRLQKDQASAAERAAAAAALTAYSPTICAAGEAYRADLKVRALHHALPLCRGFICRVGSLAHSDFFVFHVRRTTVRPPTHGVTAEEGCRVH